MTDNDQSDADARAGRFEELVQEFVETLRRLGLGQSDEQLMDAAVRMAAYRLRDEDGPPTGQMRAWPRPDP
ncbi:MAG: hypothetical protein JWN53_1488 [Gemmatimonadetes bacterium]|jgi:hypothetical protein|nr:hypothetical protein [Gemmatimonadota bacterium]